MNMEYESMTVAELKDTQSQGLKVVARRQNSYNG